MSKREDNKFLKIQTCVMRVDNICCDGCQKKVKKVLSKIDGVYTTSIDVEERKVTVTGDVDPAILIEKLNKAGKHAVLWPAKGGKNQNLINQLQKLQPQLAKGQQKGNKKPHKGGGGGIKDGKKGHHSPQQAKGFMDLVFPSLKNFKIPFKKETKKAKSDHSHKEEDEVVDEGSDFDDDFDDEFDDEFDDMDGSDAESYDEHPKMVKNVHFQLSGGTPGAKDKKAGGGGGGGGKRGEAAQLQSKGGGGKRGEAAQLQSKGGGGKKGGGGNKDGGKNGHRVHDSKSGGASNNGKSGTHARNGNPSHKGGGGNLAVGGGLPLGQPHMMGQLGNVQGLMGSGPAAHLGLPPAGGYSHEMLPAGANSYQQQYLQALMQQQQQEQHQRMMMNGQFPPASYGYGHMPQPQPYSMFSDENPDGCSVM